MKPNKLLSILILITFLFSCSSARKDQKALSRVLGSVQLRNDAYKAVVAEHPCINDTITYSEKITDHQIDTVHVIDSFETVLASKYKVPKNLCAQQVNDAFNEGMKFAKKDTITKQIYLSDKRMEQKLKGDVDNLTGQITQLKTDVTKETERGNKWLTWFIAACSVIGISLGLKIYSMFRPKLKI